jgi:hypothetical protein
MVDEQPKPKSKLELLAGGGSDPVSMIQQIVSDVEREGSEVVGIVVFARNERTNDLHTYIGSRSWPNDVDDWPMLTDALKQTVSDAKRDAEHQITGRQVH